MTLRRWLVRALLLTAGAGCAAPYAQSPRGATAPCGTRCDAMVCPQGSVCTLDANCAPRCEIQRMPERFP